MSSTLSLAQSVIASITSAAAAAPSSSSASRSNSSTPRTNTTGSGLNVQSQTPIFACVPASYNYSGGTPPYLLYIINSGSTNASVLKTLPAAAGPGTASWGVDIPPGTSVTLVIQDNNGQQEYSTPQVVLTSSDLSCLPGSSSSNHVGAIVGGVVGGVGGLAVLAVLAWFFVIRPAKRSKSKGPDFYEPDDADRAHALKVSSPPMSSAAHDPVGTFNLHGLNFNEQSLDELAAQRHAPPSYEHTGSSRITRPNERPPMP